jgi:DNA-directed RNA polymerase specialized sigma24 family protein
MSMQEKRPASCDCQRGEFDCEGRVRRFLEVNRVSGRMDPAACQEWEELLERMRPVIEKMVNWQLQGRWRQDREDVVQNTLLKLCNPEKLATWLDNPKRTWLCIWVRAVAVNCAIEWFRKGRRNAGEPGGGDPPDKPNREPGWENEQEKEAEGLRKDIDGTLSGYDLDWQVCFFMRYSYLDPRISEIATAIDKAAETVFYRLRKITEAIERDHKGLIPSVGLVGRTHPVEGFQGLSPADQNRMNDCINRALSTHPIEEKLAFYAWYSPLALDLDELASRLNETRDTVLDWLEQIGKEVALRCGPEAR